jgi:hypothetical protein
MDLAQGESQIKSWPIGDLLDVERNMFRKTLVTGLAAAALLAGTAQDAAAVDWGGNGNYCAGNLYNTCFSVNLSWTGQVATLTVENFTGEGDLIKAVGITNISNIADDFLFTLGGQAGYCRSGIDAGCPNEIGGLPSGNGQYDNAAVAATNDQGSMVADGGSGTWTFTFPAGFDMSNLANANVGGHFISGPAGGAFAKVHDVLDEKQRERLAELIEQGPGVFRGWRRAW